MDPKTFSLIKLAVLIAGQYFLITKFLLVSDASGIRYGVLFAAFASSYVIVLLEETFLYTAFYSRLGQVPFANLKRRFKHFQLSFPTQLIFEKPRGTSALRWIKEQPDQDLLRANMFLQGEILFAISPNALRDVLNTHSYDFEKPQRASAWLARIIGYGLVLAEGQAHKIQRKALTPAFNIKNIHALYPLMWEKIGIFIDVLERQSRTAGSVEIGEWSSRMTLDIIGPAALSRDFQSLTRGEHEIAESFAELLEPSASTLFYFMLHFILPTWLVVKLPLRANKRLMARVNSLRSICHSMLAEKRMSKQNQAGKEKLVVEEEHDILQSIISSNTFGDEQIVDQMLTFIGAGHETTSSAITWICHLLTLPEYQHYQELIRDEIREALPPPSDHLEASKAPSHITLESLPYLNGVCEEVLRLFPTVPGSMRQAVRDTTVAGVPVPKNTTIIIPVYAINRNPKYWGADADVFRPERWIDTTEQGGKRPNKNGGASSNFCMTTFLHGPRACIGRDFAKAELRCAVAAMIGRYSIKRLRGDDGKVIVAGAITIKPQDGLNIRMERVEGW